MKQSKWKKGLSVLMIGTFTASLLTGCEGAGDDEKKSKEESSGEKRLLSLLINLQKEQGICRNDQYL